MSMLSPRIDPSEIGRTIQFEDFEISWAGKNPYGEGYCFGSEDGRFRSLTADGLATTPKQVTTTDEAVNGVAFARGFMAVSTRCEVVVHDLDPRSNQDGPYIYRGGAHGVLATSACGFVAPMGVNGLLRIPEIGEAEAQLAVTRLRDNPINFYELALLHGDGTRDFLAAAARTDGIYTFELNSEINSGRPTSSAYYKAPGVDFVSLCPLRSRDWPYSLAGLGADGYVHFFRDIRGKEQPSSFKFDDMAGSPYSILHAKGHLFILTSEAFYSCPYLATQFLNGTIGHGLERVNKLKLRAVDAYSVDDEILIEMTDSVLVAEADTLVSELDPSDLASSGGSLLKSTISQGTFSSAPVAA